MVKTCSNCGAEIYKRGREYCPKCGARLGGSTLWPDFLVEWSSARAFLESEAGVYQYESSIIWKNMHANQIFPENILHALGNYSSNLTNLAPLQESFAGFRTDV